MRFSILLIGSLLLFGCSSRIYPDRSQFLKDGDPVPTVNLARYRSVQERPGQQKDLAVALAISGGGSRAACLGIGIMLGLEQIGLGSRQNALDEVDYLSTVSGGGFAGGAYINARFEHDFYKRTEPFSLKTYVDRQIRTDLAYSYTGVLLRANINPRLLFSYADDGDALERAIDDHVLGYKRHKKRSIRLGDLFIAADNPSQPVRYPMHFTNSSTINTMTIFPFTPDILEYYQVNGYTHRLKAVKKDTIDPFRVPLAVGIKSSGSFPVLIANTTLRSRFDPKRKYLHLFDGAMTENIGYYTAMEVLKQDTVGRKVILVVDADAAGSLYTFSKKERAYFSLGVAATLPSSGLYAKRATLLNDLQVLCDQNKITPIYFSFNAFLKVNHATPPARVIPKIEIPRMIGMLKESRDSLQPEDYQILYELLTHIGTKYTIRPDEQELLFLAGQQLVWMQKDAILEAMQ